MKKFLVALGLAFSVLFALFSIPAHAEALSDIKKRGALRVCTGSAARCGYARNRPTCRLN